MALLKIALSILFGLTVVAFALLTACDNCAAHPDDPAKKDASPGQWFKGKFNPYAVTIPKDQVSWDSDPVFQRAFSEISPEERSLLLTYLVEIRYGTAEAGVSIRRALEEGMILSRDDVTYRETLNNNKTYNTIAMTIGRAAKLASEIYYQDHQDEYFGYTNSVDDLLKHNRNLRADPDVIFEFSYADNSHFTFTTFHNKAIPPKTFIFHD